VNQIDAFPSQYLHCLQQESDPVEGITPDGLKWDTMHANAVENLDKRFAGPRGGYDEYVEPLPSLVPREFVKYRQALTREEVEADMTYTHCLDFLPGMLA
jgi:hypothetical protein